MQNAVGKSEKGFVNEKENNCPLCEASFNPCAFVSPERRYVLLQKEKVRK